MNENAHVINAQVRTSAFLQSDSAAPLRAERLDRFFIDGLSRLDVLKGASLAVHKGQVTALVGRSGSGKSTLLHLLGLLDRPNAGEIFIDATPVSKLGENSRSYLRNRYIGFVFQNYFLLREFTVLENVLLPAKVACPVWAWRGKRDFYRERALQLLGLVGLQDRARQKPATLSGGEQQRVALARALILEPKVLLCDEPTGNLDPDTGAQILDLIFNISRDLGAAVLVVTHDQALTARAARVLRLAHGGLSVEK
jgi:lipoprotein-releasing system ATP-binding protein